MLLNVLSLTWGVLQVSHDIKSDGAWINPDMYWPKTLNPKPQTPNPKP